MAKTMPRSKAADKLLQGMPEEDPTVEAPSAQQAQEAMPPMPDGMMDQTPMPPPDAGAPPVEGLEGASGEAPDIDSALSGVEAAIQGYSEDASREIRTHLEAIKDIASREDGQEESREQLESTQDPTQAPPDMPSSADLGDAMGMDERR